MNRKIQISILIYSIFNTCFAMENNQSIKIKPYNSNRDRTAVEKIISDNPKFLQYEHLGHPKGTTIKHIENPNYTTDVALLENQTVGFINYLEQCPKLKKTGLIHLLGVLKSHQRKGIGKQLLMHAESKLKNQQIQCLMLSTDISNLKARTFYEKSGYKCMYNNINEINENSKVVKIMKYLFNSFSVQYIKHLDDPSSNKPPVIINTQSNKFPKKLLLVTLTGVAIYYFFFL